MSKHSLIVPGIALTIYQPRQPWPHHPCAPAMIAAGLGISAMFTLFILPAFYVLMARDHHADQAV